MKCVKCGYVSIVKTRSSSQNKYYWSCIVQTLSDETGYDTNEMHEIIKRRFLTDYKTFESKNGNIVDLETSKSTASLTTVEFEALMTRIRVWASQTLNIFLQEPNEIIEENKKA